MTEPYAMTTAPGALPLLGHLPNLLRNPLAFLESLAACGDLVQVRVGTLRIYVACHPELAHEVLVNDQVFDKGGMLYDAAKDVLGNGLANCPHSEHRRQRRLTQPAFHHLRLPGYAQVMTEQIPKVTETWGDSERIDPFAEMSELAARVATATLFAAHYGHGVAEKYLEDIAVISRAFLWRAVLPNAVLALPTHGNRRYAHASARLRATITGVITDYRHDGIDHGDLLSMLLRTHDDYGQGLSDAEIHDQVLVFFAAGIDTTAATLAWALHMLAQQPALQQRLHTETDPVLAGRTATWDDLPKLDLTRRIITETLRLYPAGWVFTRTTTADTELGGHPILAGTSVAVSPYIIHRRADIYTDPREFDPDRWLGREAPAQPRHGYLPFGSGARKCIGASFATTQAALALASIAARWRIEVDSGKPVHPRLRTTLVPQPVPLRAIAREVGGGVYR
ncbi:cytochrome P450 [Streptomyces lavendulae]|uniref:cytochrome P450 n=1 Tax=Streptomyces lavendulae TaxID=1914 RepID=UPI0033DDB235